MLLHHSVIYHSTCCLIHVFLSPFWCYTHCYLSGTICKILCQFISRACILKMLLQDDNKACYVQMVIVLCLVVYMTARLEWFHCESVIEYTGCCFNLISSNLAQTPATHNYHTSVRLYFIYIGTLSFLNRNARLNRCQCGTMAEYTMHLDRLYHREWLMSMFCHFI